MVNYNMYEAEKNVLASLLTNPKLIEQLILPDKYFLDPMNQFCLKIFKKQYQETRTIDLTGIVEFYKPYFQKISVDKFISYVTDLITTQVVAPSSFYYYQESVLHAYKDHQLLVFIDKFKGNQITQEELINLIHELDSLTISNEPNHLTADGIFKTITSHEKTIKMRFQKLELNANIQEHDLPIIAARPGIGKTAFMLNIMEDLSKTYKCLYFNLEMTDKQLLRRLVGINSKIPMRFFENPSTDYQKSKIIESAENLSKRNVKIITGSQTIRSIRNEIIRNCKDEHVIVFIDYIGLVQSLEKFQSIYERLTSIVKELRRISLDYNCTIFVASQINRNSEKEKDKRPKISDLKETGELEQSGTTVIMLHNENPMASSDKIAEIQVIIGKNRNGPTGIITLDYNKETQRFDNKENNYVNNNDWRKEE